MLLVLLCVTVARLPLLAQTTGGILNGTISDPAGAVVPGATITATNLGTNAQYHANTTSAGLYVFPDLPAGTYSVTVEMAGFSKLVQSPIEVSQSRTTTVNLALRVGQMTQTVEVKGEAPVLQSATSEVGHQVNPTLIRELPLQQGGDVRDPEAFVFLLPGTSGNSWQAHINGGQAFTKEISVDGVPNNISTVQGSFFEDAPPYEAFQEFKLDTSNYSAEYGSAVAGVTQYQLKSGTNQFHGSFFTAIGNDVLNANDFLSNLGLSGEPSRNSNAFKPPDKEWDIAASGGGPLIIPHVYNGKDKTFIFSAFERETLRTGIFGARTTFPVADLLRGDFSSFLGAPSGTDCLGRSVLAGQIYDPSTTRACPNGTDFVRDPFLNNQVPIRSQVAKNLLPFLPVLAGPQKANNFIGSNGTEPFKNVLHYIIKADRNISEKQRISGSFNFSQRPRYLPSGGLDQHSILSNWTFQRVTTRDARISYDYTLHPNLLNHFGIGFTRFTNPNKSVNSGRDVTSLGFKGLPRQDEGIPRVTFSSGSFAYQQLGQNAPIDQYSENNWALVDNLTWVRGRHTFKTGIEARYNQINDANFGSTNGDMNFSSFQTRLPGVSQTGDPFASFLLGAVNTFNASEPQFHAARRKRISWFLQDDIKLTRKLTVNIGLRHDIQIPTHDALNRFESFIPTLPNPGAGNLPGALGFAGQNGVGRRFADIDYTDFGPRIGLAYALNSKTVVRAAYGVFQGGGGFDDFVGVWAPDFFGTVSCTPDNSSAHQPVFLLDDGPPGNCLIPAVQSPSIENGKSVTYFPKSGGILPYSQQWNFAIQRELSPSMTFSLAYVGSKGTHIHNDALEFLNQLDPKFYFQYQGLIATDISNPKVQSLAQVQAFPVDPATGLRSPFPGFSGTLGQALRPFPQYLDISSFNPPVGNSNYNSFQLSMTRRFAKGLTFITAYTISKTISDSEQNLNGFNAYWNGTNLGYNTYDRRLERSVTSYDQPQILTLSATYDLPVGPGKKFLSHGGAIGKVLGGWELAAILKYSSGFPLPISQCDNFGCEGAGPIFNSLGGGSIGRPDIAPGVPLKNPSYNGSYTSQFLNPKAFIDAPGKFGNAPRLLSMLREPAPQSESISILKDVQLTEKVRFQFRSEFFNAFNRHTFGANFLNYNDTFVYAGQSCGCTLSSLADTPRHIQFSTRIDW